MSAVLNKNTPFVGVNSEATVPSISKIILENDIANEQNAKNFKKTTQSKEHCLSEFLKEHLSNEMFSSIIHAFKTPYIALKLFLILFNIAAISLASYTSIKLLLSYLDYEVTSTIRTIYETPTAFPKVSICNVNPFTSKYGYEFLKSVTNNTFERFLENETSFQKLTQAFVTQVKAYALANNLSDYAKKGLGQDLKDSLLSCAFNLNQCTSDDFSWYYDANYGNCFSFNSGFNSTGQSRDAFVSFLPGNWHGLMLDFYVRSYENFSLFNSFWGGTGAILRIDNVSHVIDHRKDGIFVQAGKSTYVAVNREFKTILPKPYSECLLDSYDKTSNYDSNLYQFIKNSPYEYTQDFCIEQCFNKLQNEMCNCQVPSLKSVINSKTCFSDLEIFCSINVYWEIFLKNNYIENICFPQCPLECYLNKFTYTTSSYDVHGDLFVNKIKYNPNLASDFVTEEINAATVKKSFARISVFYESLSYTISQEAPQLDVFSLIANMGGNLGLFLGVSFFSLCEIITTLIELGLLKRGNKK
jgi:hypothetical protein